MAILATFLAVMLLLAGCVSSVDPGPPLAELPTISLAAPVELLASAADPLSTLPLDPLPAGSEVKVVGTDDNGAWLLVEDGQSLGWMPSVFSATPTGRITPPLVIEQLDSSCTGFMGVALDPSTPWRINAGGNVTITGSIWRAAAGESFADASLTLQIEGAVEIMGSDYLHTRLTESEAVILFRYLVTGVESGSQLQFGLTGAGDEMPNFEAAFFDDRCTYEGDNTSGFLDALPVGQERTDVEHTAITSSSDAAEDGTGSQTTVVQSGNLEVVTFQQKVPITVTLFIPPGISGTQTVALPLNVDFQVRIANDNTYSATAKLSNPDQPLAVPVTPGDAATVRRVGQEFEHTPALSQLEGGRLGPTEVCGDISTDTTWEAEASPYLVTCNVNVTPGTTLVVQPGVVAKFARGAGLYVNGVLQVLGVQELPVYFTSLTDDELGGDTNGDGSGSEPAAGDWDFVVFEERSDDENSIVEHLVLRYGGGYYDNGAIRLVNASPVLQGVSFENNKINGAEVAASELESDVWENTDVVYAVLSNVKVPADQTLEVAPGMTVKFAQGAGLYINEVLRVSGTAEQPVYFTSLTDDELGGDTNGDGSGSEPAAGDWDFVVFEERSDDENSIVEHLVLRYGGGYYDNGAIRLVNASPVLQAISFENNKINGAEVVE